MTTLNIGGNQNDAFYRYKMPKLKSKIEGKGNGIKTVIPNMTEIGKSLARPPSYPTKFFGCELGTFSLLI
jgi:translation initiation factor 5